MSMSRAGIELATIQRMGGSEILRFHYYIRFDVVGMNDVNGRLSVAILYPYGA